MSDHTHVTRSGGESLRARINERDTAPSLEEERISKELFLKATTSQYRFEDERYKFDQIIGRGGMGVVLKGYDKLLSRDVAVKFLSPELNENEDARAIFLSEARSMARLSHKNLVSVYDVGVIEGSVMMVVEFVEGQDLFKLLRQRDPPVGLHQKTVLRVGIQLCRVIGYMHAQNMIHRDIKPANVILQKDGMIKLIDFGLTRALETLAIRATRVRGTPAYMAPEQLEGGQLTPAVDIYQLGVTFFELLTARLPFEKSAVASASRRNPPDLREYVPGIEPELADCVARCLSWNPADRPSNAQEIVDIFRDVLLRITGQGTLRNVLADEDDADITGSIDTSFLYQDSGVTIAQAPDTADEVRNHTIPPMQAPVLEPNTTAPASVPELIREEPAKQRNLVPVVIGLVVLLVLLSAGLGYFLLSAGPEKIAPDVVTPAAVESMPPKAAPEAAPKPTPEAAPAAVAPAAEPVAAPAKETAPEDAPAAEPVPETPPVAAEPVAVPEEKDAAEPIAKPEPSKAAPVSKTPVRRKRPVRRRTTVKKTPSKPPVAATPKAEPAPAKPRQDRLGQETKSGPSLFDSSKKTTDKKDSVRAPSLFKGK